MNIQPIGQNKPPTKESPSKIVGIRIAAVAAVVTLLAILSSILWMAVSAGIALGLLGLLGLAFIAVFQALPLLGQKWENKLLAMRKAEARQNPIEQLQNFFTAKAARVNQFKAAVAGIGAQIQGLIDMVEQRKKSKPGYDATAQIKTIEKMSAAHAALVTKYTNAEHALVQLQDAIEDKKFEWKFGQAGQVAIASLNATSGEEIMDQILADEAFSSVRDNFNTVFAELELEAAKLSNAKTLNFDDGMTIDVSAIHLTETVPVARG